MEDDGEEALDLSTQAGEQLSETRLWPCRLPVHYSCSASGHIVLGPSPCVFVSFSCSCSDRFSLSKLHSYSRSFHIADLSLLLLYLVLFCLLTDSPPFVSHTLSIHAQFSLFLQTTPPLLSLSLSLSLPPKVKRRGATVAFAGTRQTFNDDGDESDGGLAAEAENMMALLHSQDGEELLGDLMDDDDEDQAALSNAQAGITVKVRLAKGTGWW